MAACSCAPLALTSGFLSFVLSLFVRDACWCGLAFAARRLVLLLLKVADARARQRAAMRESGMYDDEGLDDDDDAAAEVVHARHDLVGSVFAASPRSAAEFPDYASPPLRKAVCLARFAQEPLAELAYMWHGLLGGGGGAVAPGSEVLYLGLHPLASCVPQAQLLGALERELLGACNDCGVHLNAAALLPHRAPQLAFVAGLGPVKVRASKRTITEEKKLSSVVEPHRAFRGAMFTHKRARNFFRFRRFYFVAQ